MTVVALTFAVFALSVLGMAVGLVCGRRPPGRCGDHASGCAGCPRKAAGEEPCRHV